jgi:hypothetical protein
MTIVDLGELSVSCPAVRARAARTRVRGKKSRPTIKPRRSFLCSPAAARVRALEA